VERAQAFERINSAALESDILTDNVGDIGALFYFIDVRFSNKSSHEPILRSGRTGSASVVDLPQDKTAGMLKRMNSPTDHRTVENITKYATRFLTFITAVTPNRNRETANKAVSIWRVLL